jgi:hypothetical protein
MTVARSSTRHGPAPRLFALILALALVGCTDSNDVPATTQHVAQLGSLADSTLNPMTPEAVAEAFALGSESTDLQRERIQKELIGNVVEWRIPVYEIELAEGTYKVTSQPFPTQSNRSVQLLRAVVFISAQSDADEEFLQQTKTNDTISIRGTVQNIILRTVVSISPAIVVSHGSGTTENQP